MCCEGQVLTPHSSGRYAVPAGLLETADDGKVSVEARTAGEVVAKVSFSIARESVAWSSAAAGRVSVTLGGPAAHASTISGAAVAGLAVQAFPFDGVVPLLAKGAVRYIGREPGQIAPSLEERDGDWAPVWVVQTRRKGAAQFCGTDLETAAPIRAACSNQRKLREWKELLWNRRRDITPPAHARLRELWRQYQAAARIA